MRWIDIDVDRARYRATLTRRAHPRLSLGLEFNPGAAEIGPLATLFVRTESNAWPAISLGTSSDRIGTPEGNASVFLTAAKRSPFLAVPLSGYLSLNWSEFDEAFNVPFGGTLHLGEVFALGGMYDGQRSHGLLRAMRGSWSATALWVWFENFGLAISLGMGGHAH